MITLVIDGLPVPWMAHGGYGKRSFNPRFKEKEYYQWQIRAQHNSSELYGGPVRLHLSFHMPIPKGISKPKRLQMLNGLLHHLRRPDTTNLIKFVEDCLKGIVFEDDSQVIEINATKIYGEHPKTVIKVEGV